MNERWTVLAPSLCCAAVAVWLMIDADHHRQVRGTRTYASEDECTKGRASMVIGAYTAAASETDPDIAAAYRAAAQQLAHATCERAP